MRVISGTARGTTLYTPDGLHTRPTTDRIKETLFNMIQADVMDCTFLDLFSGSGGIGIEALSRGATKVVFVDQWEKSIQAIQKNLDKTKLQAKSKVYNASVEQQIPRLQESFDFIFLDPPYNYEGLDTVLSLVVSNHVLAPGGAMVLEQDAKRQVSHIPGLVAERVKDFKTTKLVFYVPIGQPYSKEGELV